MTDAPRPRPRPRPAASSPRASGDTAVLDDAPGRRSSPADAERTHTEQAHTDQTHTEQAHTAATDTASAAPEPGPRPGTASRSPSTSAARPRRAVVAAALALVIVLLVAADVVLFLRWHDNRDDRAAYAARNRTAVSATYRTALTQAQQRVPRILTYRYTTINADIAAIATNLTGTFKTQYVQVLTQKVKPRAVQLKVTTTASSRGGAIINATGSTVSVLVFINQQTTGTGQKKAQIAGSRVQATMTKVGSSWLISNLSVL